MAENRRTGLNITEHLRRKFDADALSNLGINLDLPEGHLPQKRSCRYCLKRMTRCTDHEPTCERRVVILREMQLLANNTEGESAIEPARPELEASQEPAAPEGEDESNRPNAPDPLDSLDLEEITRQYEGLFIDDNDRIVAEPEAEESAPEVEAQQPDELEADLAPPVPVPPPAPPVIAIVDPSDDDELTLEQRIIFMLNSDKADPLREKFKLSTTNLSDRDKVTLSLWKLFKQPRMSESVAQDILELVQSDLFKACSAKEPFTFPKIKGQIRRIFKLLNVPMPKFQKKDIVTKTGRKISVPYLAFDLRDAVRSFLGTSALAKQVFQYEERLAGAAISSRPDELYETAKFDELLAPSGDGLSPETARVIALKESSDDFEINEQANKGGANQVNISNFTVASLPRIMCNDVNNHAHALVISTQLLEATEGNLKAELINKMFVELQSVPFKCWNAHTKKCEWVIATSMLGTFDNLQVAKDSNTACYWGRYSQRPCRQCFGDICAERDSVGLVSEHVTPRTVAASEALLQEIESAKRNGQKGRAQELMTVTGIRGPNLYHLRTGFTYRSFIPYEVAHNWNYGTAEHIVLPFIATNKKNEKGAPMTVLKICSEEDIKFIDSQFSACHDKGGRIPNSITKWPILIISQRSTVLKNIPSILCSLGNRMQRNAAGALVRRGSMPCPCRPDAKHGRHCAGQMPITEVEVARVAKCNTDVHVFDDHINCSAALIDNVLSASSQLAPNKEDIPSRARECFLLMNALKYLTGFYTFKDHLTMRHMWETVEDYNNLNNVSALTSERMGCLIGRLSRNGKDASTTLPLMIEQLRYIYRSETTERDLLPSFNAESANEYVPRGAIKDCINKFLRQHRYDALSEGQSILFLKGGVDLSFGSITAGTFVERTPQNAKLHGYIGRVTYLVLIPELFAAGDNVNPVARNQLCAILIDYPYVRRGDSILSAEEKERYKHRLGLPGGKLMPIHPVTKAGTIWPSAVDARTGFRSLVCIDILDVRRIREVAADEKSWFLDRNHRPGVPIDYNIWENPNNEGYFSINQSPYRTLSLIDR
eukprot:TRINITY_DN6237_c0_g1_i1.p1 TRINITY_DN6237_c0_g1~~TRINITY_DN6237_c0_g1_i1.p1  ORF type:complete len:1102 (+),score=102.15 TRINITY_DN6237_c0_g1_i1:136-3306(+)